MICFDHIVIAVKDLETAARRFREDYGIAFEPGGVHPGGTKNWANLFPDGSYIELLAVHDAAVPSAALVSRFLERHGEGLFHWALRTDDIEAVAARTGEAVTGGAIDSMEGERQGSWRIVSHPTRGESALACRSSSSTTVLGVMFPSRTGGRGLRRSARS